MRGRRRLLGAEAVELPEPRAAEERLPFVRREAQHRPAGILAVAEADRATGQVRHLHAVAVGETQRALNPARTRIRRLGRTFERSSTHNYLTDCRNFPKVYVMYARHHLK